MAKLKITNTDTSGQIHDRYTGPEYINNAYVGGTGGLTTQAGRQIQPTVKVGTATATVGNIIAQKGSKEFRVTDNATPNNVGSCALVNLATPTAPNTMSIQVNTAVLTGASANAYVVSGASTSAYITGFTAAGPVALAIGQVVTGTGATGTVTIAAINSASNVTVSYTSQTFANVAGGTFNTSVYASRITNRFVYDFGSNGYLSTNIGGGYNPNKYRYHLATPDSTFVEVKWA
jgi:hypothetical protein